VTDSTSGDFGVMEILKAKMDWICGAVEKERNAHTFWIMNCIGKKPVGTQEAGRSRKLLGKFMERGCWGRSKMVVVERLDQCGTSVDVAAAFSTNSLPQERRFCGHECCKEAGRVHLL
jgi:hypothetical protein